MVRRSCLRQLSGFDEEFFLYYEDVDLCLRAQAMGWTVCYEPAVAATHLDPLQNRPLTEPMRVITRHASLTYFRKHLSPRQFWALGQLVRLETWVRQRWAQWRGRTQDVLICQELRGICRDLLHHRPEDARRRLDLLLQRVEL
jgi:GT2 family glycosyltransferase